MARSLEELREYLVGEWNFNLNFLDSSGNENHGVPTDIEWKPTARGLKPYFSSGRFVNCGKTTVPDTFTIHMIVNFMSKEHAETIVHINNTLWIASRITGHDMYFQLFDNDGNVVVDEGYVSMYPIGNYKDKTISFTVSVGNNEMDLYLDGKHKHTINITGDINPNENDFYIGRRQNSTYWHNGFIHHVSYYKNVKFTDDEVLALYNETKNAVGVRPAERSFTHRLQPDVDDNTVFATDMSTKNSDGTLMDLSW
ncbi:MAG: hypothetical protein CI952_33 [Methanohalophilus sp.]|nr:MAG: hypothetical protein CI952_33 [Methanohalophilus sp.]